MKRIISITILLVIAIQSTSFSQSKEHEQTLQKVIDHYQKVSSYHIAVRYSMLRGLTGNTVTESYNGQVHKIGNANSFSIRGLEMIQSDEEKVTINHEQKLMNYERTSEPKLQGSPIDLQAFLDYYKIEKVIKKEGMLVYEMVADPKYPQLSYSKINLHLDPVSNSLIKQELFFANMQPFRDGTSTKLDHARLVIDMRPMADGLQKKSVSISDYIKKIDGIYKPIKPYQEYKLIAPAQ